jgi:hypothetical protein
MADRKWRVLARDVSSNNVRQVYRLPGGGFTRNESTKDRRALMTKAEANDAIKWAKGKAAAGYATTNKYPFVVLDSDTAWGNAALSGKLNELGRRRQRYLWAGEYKRTSHRQWELRMLYLNGRGNLAARCCSRHSGKHSWAACGKDSWSNHASGNACDTSYLHSGRGGAYTNVGKDSKCRQIMRDLGLCLPVGGEPWHVERGGTWRA